MRLMNSSQNNLLQKNSFKKKSSLDLDLLASYDYELDEKLVAQNPTKNRSDSRLFHFQKGKINHYQFKGLPQLLNKNDVLIINSSQTIKARLFAQKITGAKIEILLDSVIGDYEFTAITKSNRTVKVNEEYFLLNQAGKKTDCKIQVLQKKEDGRVLLKGDIEVSEMHQKFGHVPLPPYIKRSDTSLDVQRYQTIYAKSGFSVAAPTAGLHFSSALLEQIKNKGVEIIEIVLDVGLGTFKPIHKSQINDHQMHFENYQICEASAKKINQAMKKNKRIIAVGSTSTRALESNYLLHSRIKAGAFKTNLFIKPNFKFKVINAMITNFHVPKSTLVIMVASFMGYDEWRRAYASATAKKYRFFSYGDCMFIEP